MYRCAQCGAALKKEKQICTRCSDQRAAPVLPTLFGFGEESMEEYFEISELFFKSNSSLYKILSS